VSDRNALLDRDSHLETGSSVQRCPVSVVVLTFNEAQNLEPCLRSVRDWGLEVFVVDSGSTDDTRTIARNLGAIVYEHPFDSHARQWEWALKNLPLHGEWVLGLDADQRITPELAAEIESIAAARSNIGGFHISRRQIFRGKWIRHGGYYPKYLLKLFRPGSVITDENDLVDHHFHVRGATAKLKHDLIEANQKEDDISFWIEKHCRYAKKLATEEYLRRQGLRPDPIHAAWLGNPDQRTLRLKKLWLHMPLYVRPFLYFFYRYFFQLGFLDGKEGAIFHFLHAFWYRLLIDIHLDGMLKEQKSIKVPQ
jgi:glycosyltransferase involved in cell wall biosynthesis